MKKMNYFLASFLGFIPSFFIYSTLGAGLNSYVKQAQTFSLIEFVLTREIYLPILMFLVLIILSFTIKNKFFNGTN